MDLSKIESILATDCGSTTSKSRLFRKINGEYRFVASGEAPTTVETPYEDVTVGIRNAVREIEELTDSKLLDENGIIIKVGDESDGVDLYVTTSSAGGGLQMTVMGIVKTMTAESAKRSALGAGAIVMDVISVDDGRKTYEKIRRLRFLRPDMILFAGGVDGGAFSALIDMAQFIKGANPQHRLGAMYTLPIVFAGNKDARKNIKNILNDEYALKMVDNVRPTLEIENSEPARNAVHELFMEHVMSHAPGYEKLMKWTPIPIMPTPAGEGLMFRTFAESRKVNLIGVGLGGATTNIYSMYDKKFVRSVSANLGMSYSICNVLKEAGIENIMRWIPFKITGDELLNRLTNKMIRPTTIPQTLKSLFIEHAVAREALRMGFNHHKQIARPLRGTLMGAGIHRMGDYKDRTTTYIDLAKVDWLGGTGGLLSHAPRRVQSALMLIDGFQVEGVTRLFQDSVFMIPHLGVLSTVHREAALEIFEKDCLIKLGTCIAFKGNINEEGKNIAKMTVNLPNGEVVYPEVNYGTIKIIQLKDNEKAEVTIEPRFKFDVGAGPGKKLITQVDGGAVGIIIDARGRPLNLPQNDEDRIRKLKEWFIALEAYSEEIFQY